jgi:hypothetical protein
MDKREAYLQALDELTTATKRLRPMMESIEEIAAYCREWLEFSKMAARPLKPTMIVGKPPSIRIIAGGLPERDNLLAALDAWLEAHLKVDKAWHAIKRRPPADVPHPDTFPT